MVEKIPAKMAKQRRPAYHSEKCDIFYRLLQFRFKLVAKRRERKYQGEKDNSIGQR